MATLYTQQSKNVQKTWFLMALFLALVVAIGYFASYYYGNPGILYIAVLISIVMNITGYWYSDKIALKMAGARPVDPDHASSPAEASRERELIRITENLAITAGLPMPKVYIIEDPSPNAFATGRNKDHAAIAVTTGLLGMLERAELEGVVAHELGHIGNRDTLLATVVVILVGLISIVADMFLRSAMFGGHRDSDNKAGGILAIVGVVLVVLSPIIATVIQLAISRKREFLADATGALMTRYPDGLAGALEKISAYAAHGGAPLARASNATAHLYISNPFGAAAVKGMHKLFMTHPPMEERVAALRGMEIR